MDHCEVLLIGGRAGVGRTSVGWEVSARLRSARVAHAVIDGDFMGQVHPAPEGDPHRAAISERNLGDGVRIVRVLLTATDETTERRLRGRELGSELDAELRSSAREARLLDERAPAGTLRVGTDGRSVIDIAAEGVAATGWVSGGARA
ncbi:hypothetical protein OG381_06890 [Streptomyces sp. NBC_00490]|uniref:hypothetical protein n=1 Tax=Streptomyces sp. NBC_00490 TaxID=2903657 RepID=UPI002E19D9E8